MVVAGPWFTRMMLNEPRRGLRVYGELYEVETNPLVSLDAIEHIGEPGNVRESIDVEAIEGGACCTADVYFKARELADPIHTTYLECYLDRRFIPPWSRQLGMSRSGWKSGGTGQCPPTPRTIIAMIIYSRALFSSSSPVLQMQRNVRVQDRGSVLQRRLRRYSEDETDRH